jgi:hypothetical protein
MKSIRLLPILALMAASVQAQHIVPASEIIQKINRGEAVEISDAEISGNLDLTELANKTLQTRTDASVVEYKSVVEVPLLFRNCTFRQDVIARKKLEEDRKKSKKGLFGNGKTQILCTADFSQPVRFEQCTFEALSDFKYSTFEKNSFFKGSKFNNLANFKYAQFLEDAMFSGVSFADEAEFKYAKFAQAADFSSAGVAANVDFKYANFKADANFDNASFKGFADFKYTTFRREVDFQQTSFGKGSDFKYTNGRYVTANR